MFVHTASLPHLLAPGDYTCPGRFKLELDLLKKSWHVVASTTELEKPGSFVTADIAGVAVQVRNFDGQLRALSNVCAHRHCLLTNHSSGCSKTMRCQYHGWEYQADGRTGRIPEPKNFVPFPREQMRLPQYPLATVGKLVFVSVNPDAKPLEEFLGADFHALLSQRFGDEHRLSLKWNPDYPANWKVPIENSLEAYHVPAVHPHTFKTDPGEDRSEHELLDHRTSFTARLPFSPHSKLDGAFQSLEGRIVKLLGYEDTRRYWQHHVFPNLLFSFTDAISLCHCIMPVSPGQTRAVVRQFARWPKQSFGPRVVIAKIWSRLTANLNKHILKEDLSIFQSIQRGMESSPHTGILGRCEERLYAFQRFLQTNLPSNEGAEGGAQVVTNYARDLASQPLCESPSDCAQKPLDVESSSE